jgi:hypothetical protein
MHSFRLLPRTLGLNNICCCSTLNLVNASRPRQQNICCFVLCCFFCCSSFLLLFNDGILMGRHCCKTVHGTVHSYGLPLVAGPWISCGQAEWRPPKPVVVQPRNWKLRPTYSVPLHLRQSVIRTAVRCRGSGRPTRSHCISLLWFGGRPTRSPCTSVSR